MKKIGSWLLAAVFFAGILFAAKTYVANNDKFEVIYSQGNTIPGYEAIPDGVRVFASPAVKWADASTLWKALGYIFLVGIFAAAWYLGAEKGQVKVGNKTIEADTTRQFDKNAIFIFAIPFILSAVCWFAGYSASLDQGSMVVTYDAFVTDFKISAKWQELILSDGGHGVNIKDDNGLITKFFK